MAMGERVETLGKLAEVLLSEQRAIVDLEVEATLAAADETKRLCRLVAERLDTPPNPLERALMAAIRRQARGNQTLLELQRRPLFELAELAQSLDLAVALDAQA